MNIPRWKKSIPRWKKRARTLLLHLILIVIASFGLFPFIWVVSTSFKDVRELYTLTPSLIPRNPVLDNYEYILRGFGGLGIGGGASRLLVLYRNSVFLTVTSVVLHVIVITLAAYALARIQFEGRDIIFSAFIVMMFLPAAGTLMALYELMRDLGLRNSLIGLALLYAGGGGGALFLMRQVFLGLPGELEDAARIDGASDLRICFQIMMPLAAPGIVVISIIKFIEVWGEFIIAATMIDMADKMPLSTGLGYIMHLTPATTTTVDIHGLIAAATLLAIVPVILVFIFLQRWFIKGAIEGLKI